MEFEDKTLVCADCQAEFLHAGTDQQRYHERGFTNEPKRCPACRLKRKGAASSGGGRSGGGGFRRGPGGGGGGGGGGGRFGGGGGGAGGGGSYGDRPPRQLYPATCSECGQQTEVPFKPAEGRPVFCRDCHQARKRLGHE